MKSRNLWISLMLLFMLAAPALALAGLDQDAPKSVDINITTNDRGADWYKNPIIIGAGVVLLVLIVALASRGGGTTVVKG